jgi:integrase
MIGWPLPGCSCSRVGFAEENLPGLRWDAVDVEAGSLSIRTRVLVDGRPVDSIPKTDAGRRTIPLDASLVASLRSHRARQGQERWSASEAWANEGYLFTDELGTSLHPEHITTRFESLVNSARLRRIRVHDTRHTAASLMLARGENVKVVAELLGHSAPTITQMIYQYVMPGMSEGAGEGLSAALLG